jgi:hypothetical protein
MHGVARSCVYAMRSVMEAAREENLADAMTDGVAPGLLSLFPTCLLAGTAFANCTKSILIYR